MSNTDNSSVPSSRPARPRDVAIVGMACVMPGAPDVETFWSHILDGVDSITEVPRSRWTHELHYDPDFEGAAKTPSGREHKSVSKWGGFIPDVGFDALKWGIPPASLASIDPAQLVALKVAAAALEDAGLDRDASYDRDRTSVIYATGSGGANDLSAGYLLRLLLTNHGVTPDQIPKSLDEFLPDLTEDTLPGVLTSVIAGRVANRLDLGGKNLTIDSACASVLVALDVACNELRAHSSDVVLCGGVDLHNGSQDYLSFTAAAALSPRGRCHSFDARADGMTLSEGCGCVVLKRLEDAERDGDRIYAVIKGIGGSSDGRHLGLTAPRQEGQVKAVRRAYADAGMSPAEVGLVEAHGTGTVAGDRTELLTTTEVFDEAAVTPGSVVIGSVKTNIGHIKCASGMAALIKASLATYHGVQPATLHIDEPNRVWDPATSPFVFLDQTHPWLDERRVTAVSGFGFGGTNFHAILESHGGTAPATNGRDHWPVELFAFRAPSDAVLDTRLDELAAAIEAEVRGTQAADRQRLRDVAASVSAAGEGPVRLALVAADFDHLWKLLIAARTGEAADGVYRLDPALRALTAEGAAPPVAFVFPGPDAARIGMAADLLVAYPELRELAKADPAWIDAMWPRQAFGDELAGQARALGEVAGPAIAIAGLAAAHALVAHGVTPARVAGRGNPVLATAAEGVATEPAALTTGGPAAAAPSFDEVHAQFVEAVRRFATEGVAVFVEVGPGRALTDVVTETLAGTAHLAVATDRPGSHGLVGLVHALAQLAVAGVPVDLAALHARRDSDPRRWEEPGRKVGWIVNGHTARLANGDPLPNGIRPANEAPVFRIDHDDEPAFPEAVEAYAAARAEVMAEKGLLPSGSPAGAAPAQTPAAAPAPAPGIAPGWVPVARANNGEDGAPPSGDVQVVMEYLRILQEMISTGSEIVRQHVVTDGH